MDEPPRSWSPGRSTRSVACRSRSPHPQWGRPGSLSDRSSHKGSRGLATGRRKKPGPPLPAGAPSRTDRAHCSGRVVGSPWRTAISPESKSAAERGGHCIGRAPRFVNSSTPLGSARSTARPPLLIRRQLKLERQPAVPAVWALEEACLESVGMQRADHKRQQPIRVQGIKQQPRAARAPPSAAATSPAAANRSATTTPHRRFTRPITARTPSDLAGALDSRGSSLKYVALSDDSPSHQFESCSPRPRARSVSASKWTRPPQRAL